MHDCLGPLVILQLVLHFWRAKYAFQFRFEHIQAIHATMYYTQESERQKMDQTNLAILCRLDQLSKYLIQW